MNIKAKKKDITKGIKKPREKKDYAKALLFLEKAKEQEPYNADIYRLIGDIYVYHLIDVEKAIFHYKKYVELSPENAKAYNMLGYLHENLSKYENINLQIEYFEKALEFMPNLKEAFRNLTIVYPRVGRDDEAVECFHKLFKLGATMDDYFNYACLKIKLKDFKEGWKHYEYRFSKETGMTIYPKIDKPKWKGQNISDKNLLVHYEQGYGDSIQFFRYLPQLKSLAKKVIFRTQNELVDLLKENIEDIEVVGMSTKLENIDFDYHVPIMSLMHVLEASVDDIPMTQGYLHADKKKINKYKKKYFDNDCLKIGISWHGAIHGNNRRNIPLEFFYPLTKLKNVKVYSFQKGTGSEELEKLPEGVEIINLGETFNDFSDTAAAMENLDLFVTSDNAVFNLAAAMSKKTFLLLGKDSEWRWFFDDETTPWYDNVKIFKKKDENDSWSLIIKRVVKAINNIKLK